MQIFNFSQYSSSPAIIDGDNNKFISYQELENSIFEFSKFFNKSKALCFLFIGTTTDHLIAYLSLLNLGFAVALFDAGIDLDLKLKLISLYNPEFVIESLTDIPSNIEKYNYKLFKTSLLSLKVSRHPSPDLIPTPHLQLQLLLSTSGTTGSPKLIRLSSKNILANALSISKYLEIRNQDRAMTSLPFHYSYGLSVLHSHLLVGASIVITTQSLIQEQFWQIFNRYACTSLAGVPYTYELLDRLGLEQLQCPSLKTLTQAGGRLSPELVTKFYTLMQKRQGRFFTMYGQTEATARIAYLPQRDLPIKAGAIGIAIPDGKLQLFDGSREIFQSFTEGELVYSGPNVMLGYAENPEDLALGDQLNGVLRTGDLGYFDDEGIYYISGRIKRISKVYGLRINLDEVEQAISIFGHILATSNDVVIKLYHEKNGPINQEACVTFLSNSYHLPPLTFQVIELQSFPLTSSGKIDYTKL